MTAPSSNDVPPEPHAANAAQPPTLPFVLSLGQGAEPLRCQRLSRYLPGRRWVGSGVWGDQPVFAKLFQGSARARVHWRREVAGAQALAERSIPTPKLLYWQALPDNRYVNVYELMQDAESGVTARQRARREAWEPALLKRLVAAVAAHHEAGIFQRDLHLDNFMVGPRQVLTIDSGSVRVSRQPLSMRLACAGLGRLLAQFDPMDEDRAESLLLHYCAIRNLEPSTTRSRVARARARIGRYRLRTTLKKAYRNSTAFAVEQTFGWRRIWDRELAGEELLRLLHDPNTYLAACGEVIKPGNTCTVWRTQADARPLVVKRYNLKNRWHAVDRALRRSRGSRSWESAMRLRKLGLPTPRPVALVEQRWGPLRRTTWLIMDWVGGMDIGQFLELDTVPAERKRSVARELVALLRLMARSGISHGDTKTSNYLIEDGCPVIIDLDPMHAHLFRWSLRRAHRRDLKRFRRNWNDKTWALWFRDAISGTQLSWEGHCWNCTAAGHESGTAP